MDIDSNYILEVEDLKITFFSHKQEVNAVRGVNFRVKPGEIVAIVGESGSGKSVTMKSVIGILPEQAKIQAGKMTFLGKDMLDFSEKEKRSMRGKDIAMIFQDPMTALNPLKTIGNHMMEVIVRHQKISKKEAYEKAIELLKKVGIPSPESRMKQFPHEFSGGMRQRVLIAMALSSNPKVLIADEPTTALDVTIQAQILKLLKELSVLEQMSIILITHDLGVVASFADHIEVMYAGLIMETGSVSEIFKTPSHPYTKALLKSIPGNNRNQRLIAIPGSAPSLIDPPKGCPFAQRCVFATEKCKETIPEFISYSGSQKARCLFQRETLNEKEMEGVIDEG